MLGNASDSPRHAVFPGFLSLIDTPLAVQGLLVFALLASVGLALGWRDRVLAFALWYVWASLFARNPLIQNPGLPFVGWLLLAHVCLPRAPYGSWTARGRPDPGGGWRMSPEIFAVAWIVMAVAYSYSGYAKLMSPSWLDGSALERALENPLARPGGLRELLLSLPTWLLQVGTWFALALELLFAPLALFTRLRPWLWLAMVGLHLSLLVLIDFADLSLGMLLIHGFTFDPGWLPARRAAGSASPVLYYDGACGLCHRTVRFVLAEDRAGRFRFAPLQGAHFASATSAIERNGLPDSVVLRLADGTLLDRSRAILEIGFQLGGLWRLLASLCWLVPAFLRDVVYNGIAAARHHLFRRPAQACPLVPPELLQRFES
jgi:predicted DCC family thiol-disulfide oxidoreductase YuxK